MSDTQDISARRAKLNPKQRAELEHRLRGTASRAKAKPSIPLCCRSEPIPLSYAQRSLWLTWRLDPTSPAYNMVGNVSLKGALDVTALQNALQALAQRHEILRTVYPAGEDGEPFQRIIPVVEVPWRYSDLMNIPREAAQRDARELIGLFAEEPFSLETDVPLRAVLYRLSDNEHILGLSLHHIAGDGWSIGLLIEELLSLYEALKAQLPHRLPPMPIQFADYAMWQRTWFDAGERDRQIGYWQTCLGTEHPPIELPLKQPRGIFAIAREERHVFHLPHELSDRLRNLGRSHGASLFMVMLSLLKLTLYRFSGERDLRIGMPIANRQKAETHGLIGYLLNLLVLRTWIDPARSFTDFLAHVRETVLDAQAHQDLPFDLLVEALQPVRQPGVHPLFQVKCTQQEDVSQRRLIAGLEVEMKPVSSGRVHFDLSLDFTDREDGIRCDLIYADTLFDKDVIRVIAATLESFAGQVAYSPDRSIAELSLVVQSSESSGPSRTFASNDVLRMWMHAAEHNATGIAARDDSSVLTYAELNQHADRLAQVLIEEGVGCDIRVGLCAERSCEFVVGMLAVLKAGGTYVPLDPSLPRERLAYYLQDSGAVLLLIAEDLSWNPGLPVLPFDLNVYKEPAPPLPAVPIHLDQAAYVIYTSGSTGHPKGVTVSHGALANYVQALLERMALPEDARQLAVVSTVAADLGHTMLFGALCSGRTLHLLSAEQTFDSDAFAAYMREHQIDVLKIVPSHLQGLLSAANPQDVLPAACLILGGEATRWRLLERIRELRPTLRVLNHYGPTETTVGVITQEVDQALRTAETLPLGKPLANNQAYVLDADLNPVPLGVAGELYLGGAQVARGYQPRAAQTAERFVASPFNAGERLYRSGDRVKMLEDGSLMFLGRVDDQVKVRGYRVELEEVARALRAQPAVAQAEVIVRESTEGQAKLYGYVVAQSGELISVDQLRDTLARSLPDYMVPDAVMLLETLPLTPNGKVDRKALPTPDRMSDEDYEAPQGKVEETLAAIWAEVLEVDRIGRSDNFFSLGGDSILCLKVVARARKHDIKLMPKQLFEYQSLFALSDVIKNSTQDESNITIPVLSDAERANPLPLSYAQARQWFLWQLNPESTAYHISGALNLKGGLDLEALHAAFSNLVTRHSALRTVFYCEEDGLVQQQVQELFETDLNITLVDLTTSSEDKEYRAAEEIRLFQAEPFDLAKGPLLRARLVRLEHDEHLLIVVMHHVISDGWSMQILIDEFVSLYRAYVLGEPLQLPDLPIQYADYAVWQRHWMEAGEMERQLEYWKEQLGEEHPVLQLPTNHPRRADERYQTARHSFELPIELVSNLQERTRAVGGTLFMVLLAGFQMLLHRYTGQRDIRIGATNANRHRPEIEGVVGFFVNTQVLRSEIDGHMTLASLLDQVEDLVVSAQKYQDLPFERLVEVLQPEREGSRQPLFQIQMDHQRRDFSQLNELPGLTIELYPLSEQGALFDIWIRTTDFENGRAGVQLNYAAELFESEFIERLGRHYVKLLEAFATRSTQCIREINLLNEVDQAQIREWSISNKRYDDRPIQALFEEKAVQRPDAIALVFNGKALSYGELNTRANQLAHHLMSLGVKPETKVGIAVERSIEMVVGLLAILKSGGAYIPLDPDYPSERLAYMMEDSGLDFVITKSWIHERLPLTDQQTVIDVDRVDLSDQSGDNPDVALSGDNLAYVIYTSGSTGKPKGVSVTHGPLSMHLQAVAERYGITAEDKLLHFASMSFDAAGEQWMLPCLCGATMVLRQQDIGIDATESLVRENDVTILYLPPAYLRQLLDSIDTNSLPVRLCIVGGEAWPLEDYKKAQQMLSPQNMFNAYGPAENVISPTVWASIGCDISDRTSVPIGSPVGDRKAYVLDEYLSLVPQGVVGELYLGGSGLARGYQCRAGLTAERFIADPESKDGERLYRTGDLVRWNTEGQLEYLGRIDHQVKIRGFRIELGEIESQLLAQPTVREAVVVADGDKDNQHLLAYVVPDTRLVDTTGSLGGDADQEGRDNNHSDHTDAPTAETLVTQWETVFDGTYEHQNSKELAPNFRGWKSSYTGQPIPEEQMQEWLQCTVDRIRALKPERILEIGCGVGLLVQYLALTAPVYVGTDLSARAVNDLNTWIRTQPALGHVQLRQAEASDVTGIQSGAFDTMVLNSVAQYLPDVDYLLNVLRGTVQVVGPQGHLFIGDLRHVTHVPVFHASIQLHKASTQTTVKQLKSRIARAVMQDKELTLDPAFFHAVAAHLGLGGVEIQLKRGRFDNELTHYRYDVILSGKRNQGPEPSMEEPFNSSDPNILEQLSEHLASEQPSAVRLSAAPNRRLARDMAIWELLQTCNDRVMVGELLSQLDESELPGIDPEALWALGDEHGYRVCISWTEGRTDGAFDVEFIERSQLTISRNTPTSIELPKHWRRYASNPVRAQFIQQLGPQLRQSLSQVLPDYMVPAHFLVLDKLPLNANGKLDRKALPNPEFHSNREYEPPQGEVEETLAKIWQEILGVKRIGRNDNFFELGGHSLAAVQVASRVMKKWGCKIPLRNIFEQQSLEKIAKIIHAEEGLAHSKLTITPSDKPLERAVMSYAQQRLWFLWLLDPNSAAFNTPSAFRLKGELNYRALRFALSNLIRRHAILRTVFNEEYGKGWQLILDDMPSDLPVEDVSAINEDERDKYIKRFIESNVCKPFDLKSGPLLRVSLLRLDEKDHITLVVMHHIVTDGWSINIMMHDFVHFYEAAVYERKDTLDHLNIQYIDFSMAQRKWLDQGEIDRQLAYWKSLLTNVSPLNISPDKVIPVERSYPCGEIRNVVEECAINDLKMFSQKHSTTSFSLLLAAFSVVMSARSKQRKFYVGTDMANRNHLETESLVGFFVNQAVIPIDCETPETVSELLKQLRTTIVDAVDHQDLPFDKLVESLLVNRSSETRSPLFNVKVLYREDNEQVFSLPGLEISGYPIEPTEVELDLIVIFLVNKNNVSILLKYDKEVFEDATIESISQEIVTVIFAIFSGPSLKIKSLQSLADDKRREIQSKRGADRKQKVTKQRMSLKRRKAISLYYR